MIRIITNTTFGYWNGRSVEPKTKDSDPFSVDSKREAELVAMGIAEYVAEEPTDEEPPTADSAPDNDFEITLEYLEGLKLDDLKEFAEQFGIKYKVGTKKTDFAQEILEHLDELSEAQGNEDKPENEQSDELDEEPTDEEPPTVDPTDAVV